MKRDHIKAPHGPEKVRDMVASAKGKAQQELGATKVELQKIERSDRGIAEVANCGGSPIRK